MSKGHGFTLIELLVVVAIVGILVAIASPNLVDAIDRSKQKRTMADIRSIGMACEEYRNDYYFYPIQMTQAAVSGISAHLAPTYIKMVPTKDGWNWDIQYGSASGGGGYTVRSLGKDGIKNGTEGPTHDFNCDIVFQRGRFIAYPANVPM